MSEIIKLYENAGIELNEGLEWVCQNPNHCVYQNLSVTPENCSKCEYFEREMSYPPFTAEKQVELIKWISHHDGCFEVHLNSIMFGDSGFGCCSTFEESLARAVSNFLRSATEKEKQKIKEILE